MGVNKQNIDILVGLIMADLDKINEFLTGLRNWDFQPPYQLRDSLPFELEGSLLRFNELTDKTDLHPQLMFPSLMSYSQDLNDPFTTVNDEDCPKRISINTDLLITPTHSYSIDLNYITGTQRSKHPISGRLISQEQMLKNLEMMAKDKGLRSPVVSGKQYK